MTELEFELELKKRQLKKRKQRRKFLIGLCMQLGVLWMAVYWVFGIAIVEGKSMQPIYQKGDILLYQRRGSKTLDYGDVVVVHFDNQTNNSVKRIVGKPGDSIEIDEKGCLTRNGETISEAEVIFGSQEGDHPLSFRTVVPEGSYFCLGDNRPVSKDSRSLGAVGEKDITGRVLLQFRVAVGR